MIDKRSLPNKNNVKDLITKQKENVTLKVLET